MIDKWTAIAIELALPLCYCPSVQRSLARHVGGESLGVEIVEINPGTLPSFKSRESFETLLGVQFDPIPRFTNSHLAPFEPLGAIRQWPFESGPADASAGI